MRLGIVTHNFPAGKHDRQNAGIFVYDLACAVKKLGNEVFVLCPEVGIKKEENEIPVTWFPWAGSSRKMGSLNMLNPKDLLLFLNMAYSGIRVTNEFVKRNNIDFMVGMWSFPAGIFTFWGFLTKKIPYTLWSLGSDIHVYAKYPLIGPFMKLILRRARFLLADGLTLAREVEAFAGKGCQYIASATNFPALNKNIKKTGSLKFIFLGRMEPVKGPDIMIKAALSLVECDFEMHCIGEGSLLPILKKQVKDAHLDKKIIFHGNPNDKNKIYSMLISADWLIMPSRNDTIPLSFSEGMKAGIPVIAAQIGDIPYFMRKYHVGLSFAYEDSEKLTELMRIVIKRGRNETQKYQSEIKRLADFFDINFSAKQLVDEVEKHI